MFICCWLSIV